MKKIFYVLIFLFLSSTYGQAQKVISIPTFTNYKNEIDTTLWFNWNRNLAKEINLKDLITSVDAFHFRLWTDIQAIDIWTNDSKVYFGCITNFARRYDEKLYQKGIYKVDKVFSNQINLDSSKSKYFFNLLDSLAIVNIPTDDKIVGWKKGFDGEEFIIEVSTKKEYFFKTYWTPRIFADTLKEAKQIQILIDRLYKNFNLADYYRKLKLPEGTYQRSGVQGIRISSTNENGAKNSIFDFF